MVYLLENVILGSGDVNKDIRLPRGHQKYHANKRGDKLDSPWKLEAIFPDHPTFSLLPDMLYTQTDFLTCVHCASFPNRTKVPR